MHGLVAEFQQEPRRIAGGSPVVHPDPGLSFAFVAYGSLNGRHHRHAGRDRRQRAGAGPVKGEHDQRAAGFDRAGDGVSDHVLVVGLQDPDTHREPCWAGRLLDALQSG